MSDELPDGKPPYVDRAQELCEQRKAELATFGIKAAEWGGGVLGSISLPAAQVEKLLKLLRKAKRKGAL